jgi:membrane-bound lytic murein transglycosylase B
LEKSPGFKKTLFSSFIFFMAAAVFSGTGTGFCGQSQHSDFDSLKQRLIKDAGDQLGPEFIESVFANPGVHFASKGISSYFQHRESKLNYGQFLETPSIKKASAYMKKHQKALERAQKTFGVDQELITAILLVETRLGTYTGNQVVINILATMAALDDNDVRQRFWKGLPEENRFSKKRFEERADARARWAYYELKAFLEYIKQEDLDPVSIKGSYAGAVGIAQFMPSNIIKLGHDGNQDGRVDLFNHEDAILSVARYLAHHGWEPGIDRSKAEKVVHRYNPSSYYVNTVLDITEKLKG